MLLIGIYAYSSDKDKSYVKEKKYIVYESCLRQLLGRCIGCGGATLDTSFYTLGSQLKIEFDCQTCTKRPKWYSQPNVPDSKIPFGNLELVSSIAFTGLNVAKTLRMFTLAGIQSISKTTYNKHREKIIDPAINESWVWQQLSLFNEAKNTNRDLVIGGDGRADSPGHSAKYGSYTTMDLNMNKVIDIQLIQV